MSASDAAIEEEAATVLTHQEKRHASRQLTLALLALGLLVLALVWMWLAPEQTGTRQLILAGAALLVAVPVVRAGWESLRHPSLHGITDQLIAIAMLGAWVLGDLLTAVLLPIIMILGHVLEERSVIGTQEAIQSLGRLTHVRARRIGADGAVTEVDNRHLKVGDHIEVRAGDRVAADGRIVEGRASLDTAAITGESVPLEVTVGNDVFGGTINLDGLLRIEVTRIGSESTLGKVIALMQSAERAKPPITRLLERYANRYLVLVLLVAAITWFVSNDAQAMLAVIVAACPCALALAAPATAVAGIAVAARHGILIRGSAFLEELADTTSLIVDKTGTLTFGALHLVEVRTAPAVKMAPGDVRALASSLGAASSHPVSRALAPLVDVHDHMILSDIRERPGLGVIARTPGGEAALGRLELFREIGVVTATIPTHDGPVAGVALNGQFLAWLLLADKVRPEAHGALRELRELGLNRQVLLTGDRASVATALARAMGIEEIQSQALPQDKLNRVAAEIAEGFRPMVVGDGINDSLALKAGVVGVAMGAGGADIALASADIVLIGSDLRRLGTCVRLSRLCRRTLQTNVAIGLGWTGLVVVAAAFGVLGPAGASIAAVLHNLSTLIVLANAGRLLRFDDPLSKSKS
ncbi:MAG TPA: heavy metal translocating P-type ATPase [Steroidobacteraceae bacterium]|nr:heavy metal translocating P-type ATPase [Steroidobacteraceae bacterium]